MLWSDAHQILGRVLAPLSVETFLDDTLAQGVCRALGDANHARAKLLGPDAKDVILGAYAHLAPLMTYHSAAPLGPAPPVGPVADAEAFAERVAQFHARGYSVRFPELRPYFPEVDALARALEFFLHKPVTASAFWSLEDTKAQAHCDKHDLIVIQMQGRKRWFISTEPPELPNTWDSIPDGPPEVRAPQEIEIGPGELLYLPRGVYHRVESVSESLHLAIGFIPLTLREAIIAVLDHLSDLDHPYRRTVGGRLAYQLAGGRLGSLAPMMGDAGARLAAACASEPFVEQALQRRSSRTIAQLKPLRPAARPESLAPHQRVRRRTDALCHLSANAENIDFSHPGGHLYIDRGVDECLRYIASIASFRIADIPGAVGDDTRLSLVERLLSVGFLELEAG